MKRLALAVLALGAVVPISSGTAHAAPDPTGALCRLASAADPTAESGTATGVVDAGPLTLGDDTDPTVTYTGSITCTVQVGANSTHEGTDAWAVTGPTSTGVASVPPNQASFSGSPGDPVYLCTQVNLDGGPTLYWDATNSEWSTSASVDCELQIGFEIPPAPFYPMGIIEISRSGSGSIGITYDGFVPDFSQWNCAVVGLTVQCDPPPAPNGAQNVCMVVTVQVTNNGLGSVSGSSRCAGGPQANATSNGPTTTPTTASASPGDVFPWTCSATVNQPVPGPFNVRCTVSH